MKTDFLFVIPVYNDWESVQKLQCEIEQNTPSDKKFQFLLVNDSSDQELPFFQPRHLQSETWVLELSRNMGHQKAIAIGLSYANQYLQATNIVVMDSDGEDRPDDIMQLVHRSQTYDGIVFAQRSKRSEGFVFRLFYKFYKWIFFLLTGRSISFGNFCLIPRKYMGKIVHNPDIWNHFSGGIIRSGIPFIAVATERGKRYCGESKMNFSRLILHGLSAVSVYADIMAIRLIIFSFLLIAITILGILSVAFIRLFTSLAIPGWATFTVLGLGIILFLALLLGLFLLFNILSMKTQKSIIPAKDYNDHIIDVKKLFE